MKEYEKRKVGTLDNISYIYPKSSYLVLPFLHLRHQQIFCDSHRNRDWNFDSYDSSRREIRITCKKEKAKAKAAGVSESNGQLETPTQASERVCMMGIRND